MDDNDDQLPDAEIDRLLSLETTGEQFSSVYDMVKELSDYEFLQEFVDHCEERGIDLG